MLLLGKGAHSRALRCVINTLECTARGQGLKSLAISYDNLVQLIYRPGKHGGEDNSFVDKTRIRAKGGDGGRGCDSIWKSNKKGKFKPPDGGNGGRGGDVVVKACSKIKDLNGIRFVQKAGRGGQGRSQKQTGPRGTDRIIKVPVGTTVNHIPVHTDRAGKDGSLSGYAKEQVAVAEIGKSRSLDGHHGDGTKDQRVDTTGEHDTGHKGVVDHRHAVADLTVPNATVILARGGQGGRGNAAFFSRPNRPALRHSEEGEAGEEVLVGLELKLLADVGIVGAPNAGKSTLLRALSNARPRVGSFAFTTLQPQLGVMPLDDQQIVIADIPGLIAGASENRGLGHAFLRHIERTKMLAFVLDISTGMHRDGGLKPFDQLNMLQKELVMYSPLLLQKPALVIANKVDLLEQHARVHVLSTLQQSTKLPIQAVSALRQEGINALRDALLQKFLPQAGTDHDP